MDPATRKGGRNAMIEFFIGLASGTFLNLLVTALVIRRGNRDLLEALGRQALKPVLASVPMLLGPAHASRPASRGTPVELRSADIVAAMRRTEQLVNIPTPRTEEMDVRSVVRTSLLSMGWKKQQVSPAIEWLGARTEGREELPALIKDANSWIAAQFPIRRSA
jgi:hypothetical protein